MEILAEMAQGLSCRDIASTLSISVTTVKTHRRNMLAKLGLRNAAQLLERARQELVLEHQAVPLALESLSRRESEVMQLVMIGLTSKQIARRMGISDLTVRKHRENLLRRLGLRSTAQLVSRAWATAQVNPPAVPVYDIGSISIELPPTEDPTV